MNRELERIAAARNARLVRDDIEWAVSHANELYLRDKPEWTARRTRELARRAEHDRQQWKRNNGERV